MCLQIADCHGKSWQTEKVVMDGLNLDYMLRYEYLSLVVVRAVEHGDWLASVNPLVIIVVLVGRLER